MSAALVATARQAARLTGWSTAICQELLDEPWMRPGGADPRGLTLRDLTLLAAAKAFKLRGNDRRRFVVRHHRDPHLDGPVVIFLFADSEAIVHADGLVIHGDLPTCRAVYDNRSLIAALEALEQPPLTLF